MEKVLILSMHFILLDVKGLAIGVFRLGLNLHAFVKQSGVWVGSVCLPLGYSLSFLLSVRLPLFCFWTVSSGLQKASAAACLCFWGP